MFTNVLVGVDGRQGGRDAIALARQLAAPEATFTLAHVYEVFPGKGATLAIPFQRSEAQQLLERERQLASVHAELAIRGEVPVGRALHELAEDRRADLLVVGSTRHALIGRVLIGDDCRGALHGAPCALAVATRGYVEVAHDLHRIGVGYDSSPESEAALRVARELAAARGGVIRALQVFSLHDVREERPIPADWPDAIDELVEREGERLAEIEGVQSVVTYGGPREELAQFGKDLDLLIVGSRSYGPVGRIFHGSVSRYLVGHATCPLLVLPRGRTSGSETDEGGARAAIVAAG